MFGVHPRSTLFHYPALSRSARRRRRQRRQERLLRVLPRHLAVPPRRPLHRRRPPLPRRHPRRLPPPPHPPHHLPDRKSTRLNSSHANISYAVFCLKKKTPCIHAAHKRSGTPFLYHNLYHVVLLRGGLLPVPDLPLVLPNHLVRADVSTEHFAKLFL